MTLGGGPRLWMPATAGWMAIVLAALAVLVGAERPPAAGDDVANRSPAPATATSSSPLTSQFPLGTRHLCCQRKSSASTTETGTGPGGAPRARPLVPGGSATGGLSGLGTGVLVAEAALLAVVGFVVARVGIRARRGSRAARRVPGSTRRRRVVAPRAIAFLRPLLRYSNVREAYVLRAVGRRFGPVLVARPKPPQPRHDPATRRPTRDRHS